MIAIQGNFAFSFVLGVVAAVNPCGFVMLPAYLAYYLGTDDDTRNTDRSSQLARALVVSAALSAGFITVFLSIGILVRSIDAFGDLPKHARWAGLVIGIAMVVAAIAMLFGWSPKINTAALTPNSNRNRSMRSMFGVGLAYATASIGCTIGLFLSVILGSFTRDGVMSGVLSTLAYGAGMGMLVTALTVTLAFARTGFSHRLRSVSQHVHSISIVIVLFSGLYLAWYWYGAIFRPVRSDTVTSRVGAWQAQLAEWLQQQGAVTLAIVMGGVIASASAVIVVRRLRRANRGPETVDHVRAL